MPGNPRISEWSKNRKNGKGRSAKFAPDLKEWAEACKLYLYDKQIYKHFDVCNETFYSFMDKERYKVEQGGKSDFLDAYKKGRNTTRKFVLSKLLEGVKNNDIAATIFSAKTYGGIIEEKDLKQHLLRKKEFALKQKEFLAKLADKYELDYDDLKSFAAKFFKDAHMEDI